MQLGKAKALAETDQAAAEEAAVARLACEAELEAAKKELEDLKCGSSAK